MCKFMKLKKKKIAPQKAGLSKTIAMKNKPLGLRLNVYCTARVTFMSNSSWIVLSPRLLKKVPEPNLTS